MFFLFGIIDSITDINYNKFLKTGFIALGPYFFIYYGLSRSIFN